MDGKQEDGEFVDNIGDDMVSTSQSSSRFRRICVFCGSSNGRKDVFAHEALSLGRELVSEDTYPNEFSFSLHLDDLILSISIN